MFKFILSMFLCLSISSAFANEEINSKYYEMDLPIDWRSSLEEKGIEQVEKATFINDKLGIAVIVEIGPKNGMPLDKTAKLIVKNLKENNAKITNYIKDNGFIQIDSMSEFKQRLYLATNGKQLSRILVVGSNLDYALDLMKQIHPKGKQNISLFPAL